MIYAQEITQLRCEITELRKIIAQQQEQIAQQREQIAQQQEEITRLQKQIVGLLKENQELKEELGTNSSNSSIPPSQDPNRQKRSKQRSGKKPGGQPGHPGHSRNLLPPDQVHQFVEVLPEACPNCGKGTLDTHTPISTEQRQQIELPEIKPQVTQFNIHTCRCGKCGKHVAADLPSEARRGFGPRLMGFLVIVAGEAKATRSVCIKLLGYLGIAISSGSVSNIQKLAAKLLESPYEAIKSSTLNQSSLNADETSWKNRGKRSWMWVGATPTMVFFKIDPSRSQAAFKRVFGDYRGALTIDRCNAYNAHKGEKQSCWSHLARNFVKISERKGFDSVLGRALQELADSLFNAWRHFASGEWSREEMQSFAEQKIIPHVEACLRVGATANEMSSKTQKTCHNLLGRFKTLWLFLYREGVEPTNNRSERELRPAVIRRKISFGSQSEWGERFIERVLTIMGTFRLLTKNSYDYFTACFQAWQANGPMPSPFSRNVFT